MATNFPGSQDSLTNPTSSDTLDSPDHAGQHADANDAIEAIELALLDGAPLKIDDANERVGIGTTSPTTALDISQVNPTLTINDTDGVAGGSITSLIQFEASNTVAGEVGLATGAGNMISWAKDGNYYTGTQSADSMFLRTNNLDRLTINSSGNVGIGTTSPTSKLEADGSIASTSRTGSRSDSAITMSYDTSESMAYIETWNSQPLRVRTYGNQYYNISGTDEMTITSTGVGIGTTSPARLLHIYEGASGVTTQNGAADLIIESDDQAGISLNTPNTGTGYLRFVDPDDNAQGGLSYAHSTDKLSLRTSGSDKVVIDSAGALQIQNGSSSAPSLVFVSDTNTGFYRYGENDLGISVGGVASRWNQSGIYLASGDWFRAQGTGGLYFQTYGGGWYMTDTTYIRNYNTKSVYLSNEIFVPNMDGTSSYNTVRFNTSTGQLMRFTSITEIKEDITSIKPMMEYLNERSYLYDLRPVLYHEKDKADGTNNTRREYISGFVAEEILDVAPELAYYDINGELQSYSNDGLIPHIVAELQRLMPMVEELYGDANPDWVAPVARPDDRKTAERELYDEASAAQALIGDPNADPFDGQRHLEDFEEE